MAKPTFQLPQLVSLYRQLSPRAWENNLLCGSLTVKDDETASLLQQVLAEENADDYPCVVENGDPDNVVKGASFILKFGAVRTQVGLVVEDIRSLLKYTDIAAGILDMSWYVHQCDVASWEEDSELSLRLRLVKRLVRALETTAAIFDHRKATLVFLREGRFDVPIRYDESDLMQMDMQAAEKLIADLVLADGHTAQRHEIGATAIHELLSTVPVEDRFSTLLGKVGELHQRFIDGYKLFAASFSYEKVRDQAESIRIEYTGKIHKTLSDIQGQLLGIPISTIVVATQFKTVTTDPGQLWINSAVLAGAFIFCVLLLFSLWNQYQTLDVISQEVARHEQTLRKNTPEIADRLRDIFTSLNNRITLHSVALAIVGVIAASGFIIAFGVYWMLTRAAF